MALANLRVDKDRQTTQKRAPTAIEAHHARSNERISPGSIPVCKGSYLDVDAILARSLPKVSEPTGLSRVKKGTPSVVLNRGWSLE
jgi:hypothetical protein